LSLHYTFFQPLATQAKKLLTPLVRAIEKDFQIMSSGTMGLAQPEAPAKLEKKPIKFSNLLRMYIMTSGTNPRLRDG